MYSSSDRKPSFSLKAPRSNLSHSGFSKEPRTSGTNTCHEADIMHATMAARLFRSSASFLRRRLRPSVVDVMAIRAKDTSRVIGSLSLLAVILSASTPSAHAQSTKPASAGPDVVDLAPVVVSGVLPGPALWKVTKGDHVMWVLGITQPLPKNMQWDSARVEKLVESSQQVLKVPRMVIGAKVGFWGRLSLIPSMTGLKKLPGGRTLKDALPPSLYSRWEVQKTKYLDGSSGSDRLRPMFAGEKLYAAAIKQSQMTNDGGVEKAIYAMAERHKVEVADTSYVMILKDPRADAKRFKQATMDDQQCLSGILDATEQALSQAIARANAWATGNIEALRSVLAVPQKDECLSALGDTDFAKRLGINDINDKIKQTWVKAVDSAIESNERTMALLPMDQVLSDNGYLTALKTSGYTVTSPNEHDNQQPLQRGRE